MASGNSSCNCDPMGLCTCPTGQCDTKPPDKGQRR